MELAKQFVDLAEKNGVRLCYENCPMMGNIATSPDMWEAIFDAVGSERLGLCYDPSHLVWQFIDPYRNIYKFADKIFHVHAKDTAVDRGDACFSRSFTEWKMVEAPTAGA